MRRLAIALLLLLPASAHAANDARLTLPGPKGSGTGSSVAALGGGVLAIGSPFEDSSEGVVHVVLDTSGTGVVGLDDPALSQFELRGGRFFRGCPPGAHAAHAHGGRGD